MNEELYHHGVLGMKWGVRHTDSSGSSGSYGTKQKSINAKWRYTDETKNAKTPTNYRKAGNISNSAGTALNGSATVARGTSRVHSIKKAQQASKEAATMSDKELQAEINRMNLERSYTSLKSTDTSAGRAYAAEILSTAGQVALVGGAVATMVAVAKNM